MKPDSILVRFYYGFEFDHEPQNKPFIKYKIDTGEFHCVWYKKKKRGEHRGGVNGQLKLNIA